ncbi:11852_t:CDS:2 [Funneliformis mosseae]|uniref:11852_t:CDS:1 n=1 Tax=Funneliformis mosseae TaxID=27381 RepID=A0A9N9N644_FUNMO|nr:11852_t:CDS:2 [Funneliformis mosseae]
MARKRKFTLALSSELTAAVAAENNSLNDKAASSTPVATTPATKTRTTR